jgi:hypothetical protein
VEETEEDNDAPAYTRLAAPPGRASQEMHRPDTQPGLHDLLPVEALQGRGRHLRSLPAGYGHAYTKYLFDTVRIGGVPGSGKGGAAVLARTLGAGQATRTCFWRLADHTRSPGRPSRACPRYHRLASPSNRRLGRRRILILGRAGDS